MAHNIIQLIVYGIATGSILALGAIGVSLIFSILRFAHFAHGDIMTVGAFLALVLVSGVGLPVLAAIPFAMAGAALLAIVIELVLYKKLRQSSPVILLISSFGMALILRSAVQLIWGPDNQVYSTGIEMPVRLGGIALRADHAYIVAGALILIALLHLFLQKTKFGKAMRAMADDIDLARISGIPAGRVILVTWAIAAGLAAVAGVFLGMDTRLHPVMGWRVLLPVFAAAILGGIGRPYGAIAGGFIIGISMELATLVINPAYKQAVAFALMIVMLIVRPTGLFKGKN